MLPAVVGALARSIVCVKGGAMKIKTKIRGGGAASCKR